MLTDTQLTVLCRKMSIPLAGIYFKDELPRKMEYNKAYIINIEDSHDGEGLENTGTHWTCMYSTKYPNGNVEAIYFDSYGQPPPEAVKTFVKKSCNKYLPYTTKDVQSLMSEVCGWYCCAFLYAVTHPQMKCGDLYEDVNNFISMFEDLTKSADFKKNELILKCFFRSPDESKRTPIDLDIANQEDNPNMIKVPITTRMV